MAVTQQFSRKWKNHSQDVVTALDDLRASDELTDVTLSCDGQKLKAHKILLAACSNFFRDTFKENPCKHPIIIIKCVSFTDLEAVTKFMYNGQVNVSQDRLQTFLAVAELLQIKGLTDVNDKGEPVKKRPRTHPAGNSSLIHNNNSLSQSSRSGTPDNVHRPPSPKRKRAAVNCEDGDWLEGTCSSFRELFTQPSDTENRSSSEGSTGNSESIPPLNSEVKQCRRAKLLFYPAFPTPKLPPPLPDWQTKIYKRLAFKDFNLTKKVQKKRIKKVVNPVTKVNNVNSVQRRNGSDRRKAILRQKSRSETASSQTILSGTATSISNETVSIQTALAGVQNSIFNQNIITTVVTSRPDCDCLCFCDKECVDEDMGDGGPNPTPLTQQLSSSFTTLTPFNHNLRPEKFSSLLSLY